MIFCFIFYFIKKILSFFSLNFFESSKPIIYVDFIGEKPINDFSSTMQFCLYLVIAIFSKNEKVRDIKRYDIYALINSINKLLYFNTILNSKRVILKASSKILDHKTSNSYLTIFKKELEFNIDTNEAYKGLYDDEAKY